MLVPTKVLDWRENSGTGWSGALRALHNLSTVWDSLWKPRHALLASPVFYG